MTPLVTVIIPCFNAEKWIAQAIESALEQTWPNKEIVVIDDGSNDGSLSVIKTFSGKIIWESGPNRGGCAARNRGIELARGRWIQFLDADDVLLPNCIGAKMAVTCGSNERVCCNLAMLDAIDAVPFAGFWNSDRYDLDYIIRFGPPQTSAPLLLREDLLMVNGFRAGISCGQEFDLYLRMAIQLGITFVSHGQTGVLIRQRKGSVSDIPSKDWFLIKGNIMMNAIQFIENAKCDRVICRDAMAQRLMGFARELSRMGNGDDAARFALTAKRISRRYYDGVYKSWMTTLAARTIGFGAYEGLHSFYRTIWKRDGTRPS